MKFAKASITRPGPPRLLRCQRLLSKRPRRRFSILFADPDPRSRDGSPEQYDDAAAVRDVTKLCLRTRCSCGGLDFRAWFLWNQKSLPHGNREHL